MSQIDDKHFGLEWIAGLWSLEPRWTVDLDLDTIKEEAERSLKVGPCSVKFFAQGAFNKLYEVVTDDGTYLMRVSLPVDPHRKTNSEVATIAWVKQHINLPVPDVIAYDDHRNNLIGFEWMLMKKLPGRPLADAWRSIDMTAKRAVVQKLAEFAALSFEHQSQGIGNVYISRNDHNNKAPKPPIVLGEIVSLDFLWGDHPSYGLPRGPFKSSRAWLITRLHMTRREWEAVLEDLENDKDFLEEAQTRLKLIERLFAAIDTIFPEEPRQEPSMLCHDDISRNNILVDSAGVMTGVVDWECVSWMPLWKACDYPGFLIDKPREAKPEKNRYFHDEHGEVNELFWEHLLHYELTELRREFLDAMRRLEPMWITVFEESTLQRDLDYAVRNCDSVLCHRKITAWLDATARGELPLVLRDQYTA